jgi:glycosyltransferase involved in cell wall biosynthesis
MNKKEIKKKFTYQVLSIELEPTHYKADLWNTVVNSGLVQVFAIYTQAKNWSPDGGHNYLKFPVSKYKFKVLNGRGILDSFRAGLFVMRNIIFRKVDVIFICGYTQIPALSALFACIFLRKNFFLFSDEFNNNKPTGRFSSLKLVPREILRKLCFKFASAVLVCGKKGIDSALKAGCDAEKIYDFPYVVDVTRIKADEPEDIPQECLIDVGNALPVIFFSGRMIERKGLPSLLDALATIDASKNWVLWIEGAGPELERYIAMVHNYGISTRCRFLGFCQYDLHSWLIRTADIVIVPSIEDNWGIVVDEGLQLGKVVISSDATGSGRDRIVHGSNGYIFSAGDSLALADIIKQVLCLNVATLSVGHEAQGCSRNVRPADNFATLIRIMQRL